MFASSSSAALRRSTVVASKQGSRLVAVHTAPHSSTEISRKRQRACNVQLRLLTSTASHHRASPVEQQTTSQGFQHGESKGKTASGSGSEMLSAGVPSISLDQQSGKVGVTWSSGIESKYHTVWLRDHCRCAACYHPKTKQRQLDTFAISPNIHPTSIDATTEGLIIEWPLLRAEGSSDSVLAAPSDLTEEKTSHTSLYPWSWLYANSYAPSLSLSHAGAASDNVVMWGRGIAQQPPSVTWDEVMDERDERGIARWLNKLSQYGFCFVSGVPATPEDTERLVRKISFVRETHYGGFWDFTSDLSHGDTAYTNLALGAHTDTTYFTDPAGLQMFHLLSHTAATKDGSAATGGESLLVDGFFAAKILRDVHPSAYQLLSTVPLTTHSAGDDDTLIKPLKKGGYPILEHDDLTGELIRVRYNNDDRSVLRIQDEQVLPFYDALKKWHDIITNVDSEYWSQLVPGTALIFDNHRVLHGRSAFTGNRRLCGAYVQHDDYRSRLAVLRKRYPDYDGVRRGMSSDPKMANPSRGVWDDGL